MTDRGSNLGRAAALLPVAGVILATAGVIGAVAIAVSEGGPTSTAEPTTRSASVQRSLEPRPSGAPCGVTLQAAIDAAAPGETVDVRGCTYEGGATIDRPITLLGGTVRVPAGEAGIRVEADGVTLDSMVLVGAQSSSYVFDEVGILAWATPEAPIRDLVIRDTEIATFGGFGAYLRNVAGILLEANDVHDVVYAGLMVLSGSGGTIRDNTVRRIGVQGADANANNAYGIVLTTQGDEPRTVHVAVVGNIVEDVPTWHALDTHGGQHLVFRGNTVRRSMRAIFITADSAGHEPADIVILDNDLLSPAPIDSNLAAITLYRARDVTISGNTVTGWGDQGFLSDFEGHSTEVTVVDNHVQP